MEEVSIVNVSGLAIASPQSPLPMPWYAIEQGGEGRKLLEWWSGVEREGRGE
jgi:hypothetical protein